MSKFFLLAGVAGAVSGAHAFGAIVEVTFVGEIGYARGEAAGVAAGAPFSVRCVFDDFGVADGGADARRARVMACEIVVGGVATVAELDGVLISTPTREGAAVESHGAVIELPGGMMAFITLEAAPSPESGAEDDGRVLVPLWDNACFELVGEDLYAFGAVTGHEREAVMSIPGPGGAASVVLGAGLWAGRRRRTRESG